MFQRNNWNNNSVTPYKRASWVKEKTGMWKYNPSMAYISDRITDLIDSKKIPPLMTQSVGTRGTDIDYMVYSWEKDMTKSVKEKMRREGDFSFIKKALFKKVYKPNGDPLIHRYRDKVTGEIKKYFVYKAINALGDSFRAKEFRTTVGKSIIDNGFMKIDKEVSDTTVMNVWYGRKQEFTEEELEASETTQQTSEVSRKGTINVYWGQAESEKSTKILSNLAPRKFTWQGREYGSVEHAYQSNKSGTFDQATYDAYNNIGGYGRKIRGKGTVAQMKAADSLGLMKQLVVESFKQNPASEAAKKLLQYENFTHNTNELIDKAFLEGLKLAEQELESTQPSTSVEEENNWKDEDNNDTCVPF